MLKNKKSLNIGFKEEVIVIEYCGEVGTNDLPELINIKIEKRGNNGW